MEKTRSFNVKSRNLKQAAIFVKLAFGVCWKFTGIWHFPLAIWRDVIAGVDIPDSKNRPTAYVHDLKSNQIFVFTVIADFPAIVKIYKQASLRIKWTLFFY